MVLYVWLLISWVLEHACVDFETSLLRGLFWSDAFSDASSDLYWPWCNWTQIRERLSTLPVSCSELVILKRELLLLLLYQLSPFSALTLLFGQQKERHQAFNSSEKFTLEDPALPRESTLTVEKIWPVKHLLKVVVAFLASASAAWRLLCQLAMTWTE